MVCRTAEKLEQARKQRRIALRLPYEASLRLDALRFEAVLLK